MSRNLLILHLTVIVWGFTGILGNLISIAAIQLVWYRVLIAFVTLAVYGWCIKLPFAVSRRSLFRFVITGGVVGLHWVLFFESIKASTVSVTLVCLSSVTLFTAILEPLVYRRRISKMEIVVGLLMIAGIGLIFRFETRYLTGILLGLAAALAASVFSIVNSKLVKTDRATTISLYEMLGALVWVSVFMAFSGGFGAEMAPSNADWLYLVLLGTVCTSGAYVAAVSVMRQISAFRVALASNMEPIYGILLAWLFFGQQEKMSAGFYAGAAIILGAVFLYPAVRLRVDRQVHHNRDRRC